MAGSLPNFDEGVLPFAEIREQFRKQLIDAIDTRRGKKVLVLDPKITGFLGLVAPVALLKEHGVEQLLHVSREPLGDTDVRSIIYLVRSSIENAQLIAGQIKQCTREGRQHDFSVYFIPRRTIVCEKVLQEEGVYGDITIGEYPLDFIPFDYDLLSLELDTAFRELVLDGDRTSLYYTARALMQLQAQFGTIANIKGKGVCAAAVKNMLTRMRKELGQEARPVGGGVDTLILLDREVDLVTPMCTQLTYEGLIDEVFEIKNGIVQLEHTGTRQRVALNSSDRLYRELRDLSFAAVGGRLGERAKSIQHDYEDSKQADKSMAELKEFASQLKSLPQISRHIGLAEELNKRIAQPGFRNRVTVEQALLDGHSLESSCEIIEEMMYQGEGMAAVLRLLALVSATCGGVPRKQYDVLRRALLHTYGHAHLLTLNALQDSGVVRRQEGVRGSFPATKKAFRLLVEDVDDRVPRDIAYTFSGYAPLSVRIVEAAQRGGWGTLEEALRALPGPHFEVVQTVDTTGLPIELPAKSKQAPGSDGGRRKAVLVMFIGGVTFAEIAALRFLSSQPDVNYDVIIATTKLINGNTLLDSFIDSSVKEFAAAADHRA